jgi:hypothetical protein
VVFAASGLEGLDPLEAGAAASPLFPAAGVLALALESGAVPPLSLEAEDELSELPVPGDAALASLWG